MQMSDHFEPFFHKYMFAYRKSHGFPMALLTLTEQWKEELDNHKVIGAVAMDLSKAFDCLPHDLILEKLAFYGLNQSHFCAAICHLDINGLNLETLSQAGWACPQGYHKAAYWDQCFSTSL